MLTLDSVVYGRFIYVRYAAGLVKEGVRLLHTVAILFLGAFVVKRGGTRDTNGWDVKIIQCITLPKYKMN